MADELVVMCSGAFVRVLNDLLPAFHCKTGQPVKVVAGSSIGTTSRAIPVRLRAGEMADLVILFDDTVDELMDEGLVARGTKIRLATSAIGVAVPRGAARPDIGSVAALRRAMFAAKSFAYSASASGIYVATELARKLDLPAEVCSRGFCVTGEAVGAVVARREAELGFQQMSELLPIKGIDVLGALPADVEQLSIISAGIPGRATNAPVARALVSHLQCKELRPVLLRYGLGVGIGS